MSLVRDSSGLGVSGLPGAFQFGWVTNVRKRSADETVRHLATAHRDRFFCSVPLTVLWIVLCMIAVRLVAKHLLEGFDPGSE